MQIRTSRSSLLQGYIIEACRTAAKKSCSGKIACHGALLFVCPHFKTLKVMARSKPAIARSVRQLPSELVV